MPQPSNEPSLFRQPDLRAPTTPNRWIKRAQWAFVLVGCPLIWWGLNVATQEIRVENAEFNKAQAIAQATAAKQHCFKHEVLEVQNPEGTATKSKSVETEVSCVDGGPLPNPLTPLAARAGFHLVAALLDL